MKKVFSNSNEVPHLWAHKTQSEARSAGRGNIFFDGDTIYSYGRHFPIARHVSNGKDNIILFTTRTYSVTTSSHCSMVRGAIPATIPVVHVSDVSANPSASMLDEIQAEINELAKKAARAKSHNEFILRQLEENCAEFRTLAAFINPEWLAEQAKQARETVKAESKARKEREAKQLAEAQNELRIWLLGGNARGLHCLPFDYMRVEGDEIATTKGARVPIDHVRKVAPLIISMLEAGKTYRRNGHSIHLGNYVIDSLDENGVLTVGCHRFEKTEVMRINALLGGVK